jgi:hypothetical protein
LAIPTEIFDFDIRPTASGPTRAVPVERRGGLQLIAPSGGRLYLPPLGVCSNTPQAGSQPTRR